MDAKTKRQLLINRIHNLANDLRSNLITWKQFDDSIEQEIDSKITFDDDKDYREREHYREVIKSES